MFWLQKSQREERVAVNGSTWWRDTGL